MEEMGAHVARKTIPHWQAKKVPGKPLVHLPNHLGPTIFHAVWVKIKRSQSHEVTE